MLEGVRITPGSRYTYTIFIDNDPFIESGVRNVFSFQRGGLARNN